MKFTLRCMTSDIATRVLITALAVAALPAAARAQTLTAAARGCPPAPTTHVASRTYVPSLGGVTKELAVIAPHEGWELGRISWLATDRNDLIYLLQRGVRADPIVVVNREGRVVRSWGKGLFNVPHSIRIDASGNVWTTDAYSSIVRKFSPNGRELLTIEVGDVPTACAWQTRGATDIAFGPNEHVYVADGYANARIVEYMPDGQKVREWGTRGSGPGEFNLPHSIVVDEAGIIYVADRENSRVQRFSLDGTWLGEWSTGGKPYTIVLAAGGGLWVGMLVVTTANALEPTLARIGRDNGAVTGSMIVSGGHGIAALRGSTQLLIPSGNKVYLTSITR